MHLFNLTEEELPNKLYRYVPWNGFTKDTIENHHIYLSLVRDFNDEYEFMTPICRKIDDIYNDPAFSEVTFYEKEDDEDGNIKDITEEDKQSILCNNECLEKTISIARDDTRVCCLTNRNDNDLMWERYGSNYEGLCLEWTDLFSTDESNEYVFGKVEYLESEAGIPRIKERRMCTLNSLEHAPLDLNAPNTIARYFIKSPDWRPENEYRLIRLFREFAEMPEFFDFDSRKLTGIYCGVGMCEDVKREVYEFIKKYNADTIVYEAKRDGEGFIFEPYKVQR